MIWSGLGWVLEGVVFCRVRFWVLEVEFHRFYSWFIGVNENKNQIVADDDIEDISESDFADKKDEEPDSKIETIWVAKKPEAKHNTDDQIKSLSLLGQEVIFISSITIIGYLIFSERFRFNDVSNHEKFGKEKQKIKEEY